MGITCKNATLWLIVPPCVILIVSCLKSKNVTLLLNCNTSKNCSLGLEFVAQGYVALMYMTLAALTWIVAAFLDTKIWVCHRMGSKNCGVVMNCTLDEVRRRDEERRTLWRISEHCASNSHRYTDFACFFSCFKDVVFFQLSVYIKLRVC